MFIAYIDSDMAGNISSIKSTSVHLVTFARGAISWQSNLQKSMTFEGRVHCYYQSLQGDVVDEEIHQGIGYEAKALCCA